MRTMVLSLSIAALLSSIPAAATPNPCAAPERRQFDFWVGKWDVYAKADPNKLVAHSLIESLYDGCAVRENWMPLSGHFGGSLNSFDSAHRQWRQFWADAQGGSAFFTGGLSGKAMVLTGVWPQPGHPTQITRMTYTPLGDGSVEQMGVTSDDDGKTWQPGFDFLYRKAR
ncbi:MAG TPA: hypothetical protein VGG10_02010 [Rhizomicrobium sp.]|jgi:hypothetical protein